MKSFATSLKCVAAIALALVLGPGCASDGGGSSHVSGSVYYGVGFYDPWYYGPGYYPPDIIVTPPSGRPERPVRPEHPIARPPPSRPTPMPSIPSAPRMAPRGGRR
jgi:hypothetical protein